MRRRKGFGSGRSIEIIQRFEYLGSILTFYNLDEGNDGTTPQSGI